jgi:hypothetical protein
MKFKHYAVLALIALSASACEKDIQIVDGQIPAQYLPEAQAMMGTYSGRFVNSSNALNLSLEGNLVVLTPAHDLIDVRCGSSIGALTSVGVTKDANKVHHITSATFDFNPGLCIDVQGDHIDLSFNTDTDVTASIYDHSDARVVCTIVGGYPYGPPYESCGTILTPIFRVGEFFK